MGPPLDLFQRRQQLHPHRLEAGCQRADLVASPYRDLLPQIPTGDPLRRLLEHAERRGHHPGVEPGEQECGDQDGQVKEDHAVAQAPDGTKRLGFVLPHRQPPRRRCQRGEGHDVVLLSPGAGDLGRRADAGLALRDQAGEELGVLIAGVEFVGVSTRQDRPVVTDDRGVPRLAHRQALDERLQDGTGEEDDSSHGADSRRGLTGHRRGDDDRRCTARNPHQPADARPAAGQRLSDRINRTGRKRTQGMHCRFTHDHAAGAIDEKEIAGEELQRGGRGGENLAHGVQVPGRPQRRNPPTHLVELPDALRETLVEMIGGGPRHDQALGQDAVGSGAEHADPHDPQRGGGDDQTDRHQQHDPPAQAHPSHCPLAAPGTRRRATSRRRSPSCPLRSAPRRGSRSRTDLSSTA